MNWQHLRTFVWLRWRLMVNASRRGGKVNAILTLMIAIAIVAAALPLFVTSFVLGLLLLPAASPAELMFVWDGLVLAFLFFWSIGLLTELQRTESLSVDRFLHLPVSVRGVFAINYVSSLVRLSVLIFAPILFGLGLALSFTRPAAMLLALPLTAAMFLLVSALGYQFQGWLASLMTNPRRRRTVTAMSVATFVLVCQLPQLLSFFQPWRSPAMQTENQARELTELNRLVQSREITPDEYAMRSNEVTERYKTLRAEQLRDSGKYWMQLAIWANQFLPVGWLPYGVMSAAESRLLPGVLGLTGMTLLGTASLWRAYRTTLRIYQGGYTAGRPRAAKPVASPSAIARPAGRTLMERRLPGLSEPVSAVALAGFRGLLRAPEAKMMLLTPLLMGGIFGALLVKNAPEMPIQVRPLLALGAMMLVLFGLLQIMSNQFGFDRDGFRVFVLSAIDRREILLGKNLAFAPLAFGLMAFMLIATQIVLPLDAWQLLAAPLQFVSMYLLFCLLVNIFSIYTPLRISSGAIKAANPNFVAVFAQMLLFMVFFPLATLPATLPLAIEALLNWDGRIAGSPVNLLLSLLLAAASVAVYHFGLKVQAQSLAAREQKILETVTDRAA